MGSGLFEQISEHSKLASTSYEQASEWIYAQEAAHRADALVTMTAISDVTSVENVAKALNYYLSHDGQRESLNLGWLTEDNYAKWKIVYRFDGHGPMLESEQEILAKHFILTEEYKKDNMVIYVYERKE
jgi:hypothetical protein